MRSTDVKVLLSAGVQQSNNAGDAPVFVPLSLRDITYPWHICRVRQA